VITPKSPSPADPALAAVWGRVVATMPELRRCAQRMASVDRRLSAEDLLQDAIADIGRAHAQYDPTRGEGTEAQRWKRWAVQRIWKARTYALRRATREESKRRRSLGADDPIQVAVPVGADGHEARGQALCDLEAVLRHATPDEREAVLVVANGFDPNMISGGAKEIRRRLRRLRAAL
jgi:DNA-directed RNA polymerase specialized sigma24 family protein